MTETTKKELAESVKHLHEIASMLDEEDYDPTETMVVSYEWFSDLQDKLSRYTHLGYHPVMHVPCPQHHLRHALIMRKYGQADEKSDRPQAANPAQRTDEWYAKRAGIPSASRFGDVMAMSKKDGKPLKARKDYLFQLVAEKIAGPKKGPQTAAMLRGIDLEPLVLDLYTKQTRNEIEPADFMLHESGLYGASPDGLIGETGLIEAKTSDTHIFITDIATARDEIPERFKWQMVGQCLVTGRQWCDLAQYCEPLNAFRVVHFKPAKEDLDLLHDHLTVFVEELKETEKQTRELLADFRLDE